jgi:hypothetical protein
MPPRPRGQRAQPRLHRPLSGASNPLGRTDGTVTCSGSLCAQGDVGFRCGGDGAPSSSRNGSRSLNPVSSNTS